MIKKPLILLSLIFTACFIYAGERDLILLKELTEKQITFIESGENKEIVRPISIKIPKDAPRGSVQTRTAGKTPAPAWVPQKYDFSTKTVYGQFKVLVFEEQNAFSVSFSTDYTIQGYKIVDTTDKSEVKQENLNDVSSYTFKVNRPFKPIYILILSLYKDEVITQNIIPLYQKANIKYK